MFTTAEPHECEEYRSIFTHKVIAKYSEQLKSIFDVAWFQMVGINVQCLDRSLGARSRRSTRTGVAWSTFPINNAAEVGTIHDALEGAERSTTTFSHGQRL